jgi:uncharacterized protein (DUF1778 family)
LSGILSPADAMIVREVGRPRAIAFGGGSVGCIAKSTTIDYVDAPPQTERSAMAVVAKRKEHPLSMRLPEADIALIDRAAMIRGRSRTEFVRDAAVRAAEEVIMDTAPIRMSEEGFGAFMKAISGPPTPVPAMVELLKRPPPWRSGR